MKLVFAAMFACVLLFGCCATTEQQPMAPLQQEGEGETGGEVQEEAQPAEGQPGPEVIPAEQEEEETSVAHSQEDCAVLAHNCEACTAKAGCGWCKSSNSCLYGTDEGPSTGQCPEESWGTRLDECSVVQEGDECYDITNCVSCMSGTGCKWCIQGSVCAPESAQDECFGGWLGETYQCNYASR